MTSASDSDLSTISASSALPHLPVTLDSKGRVRVAKEQRRLVLSGDTRQHGAVEASDALLAIERHGGRLERVELDGFELAAPGPDDKMLAVHEALEALRGQYPVQAEFVKLRYFGGLTNEEISQVLGISLSTINNYWTFSRAWLFKEIRDHLHRQ